MKITRASLFALMLPLGIAVVAAGTTAAEPLARSGFLMVTKDCTGRSGEPGSFCTLTSSNIPVIKAGSKVFYTQATGVPPGMLDSNVILDAGEGNRAVGR